MTHRRLSVVLPSFRDFDRLSVSLPDLVNCLRSHSSEFEVLVSEDGPLCQQTETLCRDWGCRYIGAKQHRGKGAAVSQGLLHASGKYQIFTDADLPFGPQSVVDNWVQHQRTQADLVLGNRYLTEVPSVGMRKALSRFHYELVGPRLTRRGWDTQCGLKGFRGNLVSSLFTGLRTRRFAFDIEVLRRAVVMGLEVSQQEVTALPAPESHVKLWVDGPKFGWDLLQILWHEQRTKNPGGVAPLSPSPV